MIRNHIDGGMMNKHVCLACRSFDYTNYIWSVQLPKVSAYNVFNSEDTMELHELNCWQVD